MRCGSRRNTLRGAFAGVVTLMAAVACVPPEESVLDVARYGPETAMGQIQAAGVVRIGVPSDKPPFTLAGGEPGGFTVDLGRHIARALKVPARIVPAPNAQLAAMIASGDLDVAFPLIPLTETTVKGRSFSDPYYVGHTRLLEVPGTRPPGRAREVCSIPDPVTGSGVPVGESPSGQKVTAAAPGDCLRTLLAGRADAIAATDVTLMGLLWSVQRSPKRPAPPLTIAGDDLTTEGYGALVPSVTPNLVDFVNAVLYEVKRDGRWTRSYGRWIEPLQPDADDDPPDMTTEEAAALWPKAEPSP